MVHLWPPEALTVVKKSLYPTVLLIVYIESRTEEPPLDCCHNRETTNWL
jgi:hypothetical protein